MLDKILDIGFLLFVSATPVVIIAMIAARIAEKINSKSKAYNAVANKETESNLDYRLHASAVMTKKNLLTTESVNVKQTFMHNLKVSNQ